MTVAAALVAYVACVGMLGAVMLRRARWTGRAPLLAIATYLAAAWSVIVALGLAGLVLSVHATALGGGLSDLIGACVRRLRAEYATSGGATVAALGLIAAGAVVARTAVAAAGHRRAVGRQALRHARTARLVGRPDPALGAVVLEHPEPAAYCVAGRQPTVILTSGAVRALDPGQLDAVLAHERAHLAGRHHRLLAMARISRQVLPFLPLMRDTQTQVERLVELHADDAATRARDPRALATALVVLATGGAPTLTLAAAVTDTVHRINRLLGPAEQLGRARRQLLRAAAVTLALAPVTLALAPAMIALALGRAPRGVAAGRLPLAGSRALQPDGWPPASSRALQPDGWPPARPRARGGRTARCGLNTRNLLFVLVDDRRGHRASHAPGSRAAETSREGDALVVTTMNRDNPVPWKLAAGPWRVNPDRSHASFEARVAGYAVRGTLPLTGSAVIAEPIELSSARLSARTGAVSTGTPGLDRLLTGPRFLDARAFPEITFTCGMLAWVPAGWRAVGHLQVRGREHELACQLDLHEGEQQGSEPHRLIITSRWVIDSRWVTRWPFPGLSRRIVMACRFALEPGTSPPGAAASV